MQVYQLEKESLHAFLTAVQADAELIAPVRTDVVRFSPIKDPATITLTEQSYEPAKKYFFPAQEVLFQFTGKRITVPAQPSPRRVFFGLRKCDLNAIRHQDMVYEQLGDPHYLAARKNCTLIGYHCETPPSRYCFCGSLDLVDYFDLMLYERDTHYLVEVGSEHGKEVIELHKTFFSPFHRVLTQNERKIWGADRLTNDDITDLYDDPGWKEGVDQCLSCGACTTLCPTCYCFEIHDEVDTKNTANGERKRSWSSCQLQEFTRVAGDHVFRKEREARFKHRIFHQLDYFKEKYGVQLCVGCGRCISGCPTKIDFVQIINTMQHPAGNSE